MKNLFIKVDSTFSKYEIDQIAIQIERSFPKNEYNFIILDNRIDTMSNEELYKLFEKIYIYKKELNDGTNTNTDKQTTISDFDNTKC